MQVSIFVTDYLCHQPYATLEAQASRWPFLEARWAQLANWQRHAQPAARLAFNRIYNTPLSSTQCLLSALQYHDLGVVQLDSLMLAPVHLAMQRDSFSLQGQVALTPTEYQALTQTLSSHFAEDFDLVTSGTQQYWWVKSKRKLDIHLPWLGDYLYANAHAWSQSDITYGEHAPLIRSWTNEMQMLLHAHPINQAREVSHQTLVNSLWFSQASHLPNPAKQFDAVIGQGAVFEGLCAAGLQSFVQATLSLSILKSQQGHIALVLDDVHDLDWSLIEQAIMQGILKRLSVSLPWGHQSVSATYNQWQRLNPFRHAQSPLDALATLQDETAKR